MNKHYIKNNITINDIKELEVINLRELTPEQREEIKREYERLCMDKAEDWETLLTELINKTK